MNHHLPSDESLSLLQRKIPLLYWIVVGFVLIVMGRLYYLQVHRGEDYLSLSEQISVRDEELKAPRGRIYDRNGRLLADNRPYLEISVIPQYLTKKERTVESLASILPVTLGELNQQLTNARYQPAFMPVVLVTDATYDWIARLRQYERPEYDEESAYDLQGVEVRNQPLRVYLYTELFSQALGYLNQIDKKGLEELKSAHPERYSPSDLIGAAGLEKIYDLDIRGYDGVFARVVDARGHEVRGGPDIEILKSRMSAKPTSGHSLTTTLDLDAQKVAFTAMAGRRGAVVAMDPRNGEVLVLLSTPGYDANRITKNVDREYWKKINLHPDKYLFNRTVQGLYPPGSIYKLVPVFAALETGAVSPEMTFHCGGGLHYGGRFFKCWKAGGHGTVNMQKGIAQSCDVYFYNVGLKLGVDTIKEYAGRMGFGVKTGIDLPFEQPGLIPSKQWKRKKLKAEWMEGETLSIVIGQGYDLISPVQAAKMIAMVANGGYPLTPHLGKEIKDAAGKVVRKVEYPLGPRVIGEVATKMLRQGTIDVVHGAGTATKLKASPYKIAGKTGTAQVIGHDSRVGVTERTRPHGWFVGFAPYDNPQIAVAAIVENGGSGSGVAAPVVRAVIDAYLGKHFPKAGGNK